MASASAMERLAGYAKDMKEKAKRATELARRKLEGLELDKERTVSTVVVGLGATMGPALGAYAAQRLVDPEHEKVVAAVSSTGAVACGVAAVMEPEAAPYLLSLASVLSGPMSYLSGKKGAEARAEAKAKDQP